MQSAIALRLVVQAQLYLVARELLDPRELHGVGLLGQRRQDGNDTSTNNTSRTRDTSCAASSERPPSSKRCAETRPLWRRANLRPKSQLRSVCSIRETFESAKKAQEAAFRMFLVDRGHLMSGARFIRAEKMLLSITISERSSSWGIRFTNMRHSMSASPHEAIEIKLDRCSSASGCLHPVSHTPAHSAGVPAARLRRYGG
jgi:hypothetical protein